MDYLEMRNIFEKFTNYTGLYDCNGLDHFTKIAYHRFEIYDEKVYWDDYIYSTVLDYFEKRLIPHKINVFDAGIELMKMDWFKSLKIDEDQFRYNLWLHDLSKFSTIEALPYATHDFSKKGKGSIEFQIAWCHHKSKNEHHPEFWLNPNRQGTVDPLPMPNIYIAEMIADWIGAGRTYGDELETWAPKNFHTFNFHPETKEKVKTILNKMNISI